MRLFTKDDNGNNMITDDIKAVCIIDIGGLCKVNVIFQDKNSMSFCFPAYANYTSREHCKYAVRYIREKLANDFKVIDFNENMTFSEENKAEVYVEEIITD